MTERLIGYGYTNSSGVATLDYDANGDPITGSGYTGTGAGEIDLLAKLHDDNSVVTPVVRLFDCPVFDGNNTPASLDLSGTNNAVLTDEVVTLSCAVKNSSNNPCINIPVAFKQGNTVLGTAYTDCSGVATITYTWADSDIFNVTAQVGQSLSEDLTMFVKDKDINYLTYDIGVSSNYNNIWSTSTTSSLIIVTRTDEYTEFREAVSGYNIANTAQGLTGSCIVEFDFYQVDGENNNSFIQLVNSNAGQSYTGGINISHFGGSVRNWYHIKLKIQNGVLTATNTTNGTSFTRNLISTPYAFNFWTSGTITTIRFKNFIIYSQ